MILYLRNKAQGPDRLDAARDDRMQVRKPGALYQGAEVSGVLQSTYVNECVPS